jgi:hypothetical protein
MSSYTESKMMTGRIGKLNAKDNTFYEKYALLGNKCKGRMR